MSAGAGGKAENAQGNTPSNIGGLGGAFMITGGNGGDASAGADPTGGQGGYVTIAGGTGGQSSFADSGDMVAGKGGKVNLRGGTGGVGTTTNGAGGDINLYCGSGGDYSSGLAGDIYFHDGSASQNPFIKFNGDSSGDVNFLYDNSKLTFGAEQDVSLYFDGSDWIFNSEGVTANDEVHFTGFDNITTDSYFMGGHKSSDGTTGITQTVAILDGDGVTTHTLVFKDGLLTAYSSA